MPFWRKRRGRVKVHQGKLPPGVPQVGPNDRIVNKPPDEYAEALEKVVSTVSECMLLSRSNAGISAPTGRHYFASVIFTSLITRAVTLVFISPYSPWSRRTFEHWDHASVANVARTVMEMRLNFRYLCSDGIGEDEWNCRWNLFNLHDCTARIDLMTVLGNADQVTALAGQADELRVRLLANPYFSSLPDKRRSELLRGKKAHLVPLETIAAGAGIETKTFKMMWQLMSSHVHALPFSFYRVGGERGTGVQTTVEEGYTTLLLSFVLVLLVGARDEFREMFDGLSKE